MTNADYGTMPIGKLIRKLAIPSMVAMIVGSINMVIDGVFMGNFIGSSALAAVNLVMPIMIMVFGIVGMIGSGAGVRIGVLFGEGKKEEASRVFSASIVMMLIVSSVIALVAWIGAEDLIFSVIPDEALAGLAYDYVKVMIPAIPLIAPLFAFDNFLMICGKVTRSTWVNIWTAVINIALNWYFIVYLGKGVSHAALATTISMALGSVFLMIPFLRNRLELKLTTPKIPVDDMKMIIYNGTPELLQGIAGAIMAIITNGIMFHVAGTTGVAAMSVISYVEMLLVPVLLGIIGSIQPIVSFNIGAKNYGRVRETFRKVSLVSVIISGIALGVMLLFPETLVGLFASENDTEMIKLATTGLLLYAPSYLFVWFNMLVGIFLTASERAKEAMTLMLVEAIVFPLIGFVVLSAIIGVNGIFLAQTLAAVATCVIALILWKKLPLKEEVSQVNRP